MVANKCIEFKNSTDNQQELYFYGDIVADEWSKWVDSDTCPQDIQNILSQIDDNKPLDIFINSGGGSVFAGLAIYNMLKRSPCNKTVHIDGLAGSIASVIAMAGDKIMMPSNAFLMIHKPWNLVAGNANDMRKMADDLDRIEGGILNVYSDKLAKDCNIDTIKQMMNDETWIVGSEASQYFDVEVIQDNKSVACANSEYFDRYKHTPKNLMKNDDTNTNEGCMCGKCTMSQDDNCQPNCDSCMCSDCNVEDCQKDKINNTENKTIELLKAKLALECEL